MAFEESMSFDLTPYDLASAIDAVDKLLVEQAKEEGVREGVREPLLKCGRLRDLPGDLGFLGIHTGRKLIHRQVKTVTLN